MSDSISVHNATPSPAVAITEQMPDGRAAQQQGRDLRAPRCKTLVFCTSYCLSQEQWHRRYRRWVDAIQTSNLIVDQLLIIDDGSDVVPDWPDLQIIEENSGLAAIRPVALFRFNEHLGRHSPLNFPGWYRSFAFAAVFAQAHGFEKIVHIESDAFLISARVIDYINQIGEGWIAFWCKSCDFPETAIQIVAGNAIMSFRVTTSRPYNELINKLPEKELPFTHVEKSFVGDRYGEYTDRVPRFADFAAQMTGDAPADRFWWLTQAPPVGIWRKLAYLVHFAQKPLRFAQKPLPDKWAAIKATVDTATAWIVGSAP